MLIQKAGYPSETHVVTTDDGFILEMHRIPHGKGNDSDHDETQRPLIFVQHGLLCSSADWVLSDPPQALGNMVAAMKSYISIM